MSTRRILLVASIFVLSAAIMFAAHLLLAPTEQPLAGMMPDGALFYLESPDFHALLAGWSNSPEKEVWLRSDNYAVFSKSRLFGRLDQAQTEFASAAGLPPDMQLLSQVAGKESAFAWYDIGKLEFLYITHLPSVTFTQSTLWQSRSKFESRQSGKLDFYVRTDPESQRSVAFASSGDWVILGTREDLVANALALISGTQGRSLRDEAWYTDSIAAAKSPGDLRMVLNLEKIVPSPYFRSYWIQQNITEMKQYRAAISDLYRGNRVYREERVLLRRAASGSTPATPDISQLASAVPTGIGFYKVLSAPTPPQTLDLLKQKLLDPRPYTQSTYQYAPTVTMTDQISGQASDFETRIDQAPPEPKTADMWQPLLSILQTAQLNGLLLCESSAMQTRETFAQFPSAIVLSSDIDWNSDEMKSILAAALDPQITTARLGLGWKDQTGYAEFDGLLKLALAAHGKYLILSNDPPLLLSVADRLNRAPPSQTPSTYTSAFKHSSESSNFYRIAAFIDRAGMRGGSALSGDSNQPRQPAFFSGNAASFSQVFSGVSSESMVVHDVGQNVTQTVTYQWQ